MPPHPSTLQRSCMDLRYKKLLLGDYHFRYIDDSRFLENQSVLQWFTDWEHEVSSNDELSAPEKGRRLLSTKTRFDLKSMILGFQQYCFIILRLFPGAYIYSYHTSQDGLEQFFGQQRAQQGQNNNPTENQYGMLTQHCNMLIFHEMTS